MGLGGMGYHKGPLTLDFFCKVKKNNKNFFFLKNTGTTIVLLTGLKFSRGHIDQFTHKINLSVFN